MAKLKDPFTEFEEQLAREQAAAASNVTRKPGTGATYQKNKYAHIPMSERIPGADVPGSTLHKWNDKGQMVFKGPPPNGGGNGPGRKKGGRNALANKFFWDLHEAWEREGQDALRRMIFNMPEKFVEVVAKLMPQKVEVRDTTLEDIDEDRLYNLLSAVRARLKQSDEGRPGVSGEEALAADGAPAQIGSVEILPPLREAT